MVRQAGGVGEKAHSEHDKKGSLSLLPRIPHIRPVIEALLNQTYPCEIVVNIPFVMGNVRPHGWHGKPGVVPDWLISINPRVHVHRVEQDYGPATKLVGTMIWLERAGWDN